jgi:hypothetical protein
MALVDDYARMGAGALALNEKYLGASEDIYKKIVQLYGGGEFLLTDQQKKRKAALEGKESLNKAQQRELDKINEVMGTESTFGQSYLDILEKQKVRDVSAAGQSDISRGLFGLRDRGAEWEGQVGAPSRLKLEDLLTQGLSSALAGLGGFYQNINAPYPDTGALTEAYAAQAGVPSMGYGSTTSGSPISAGAGFGGRTYTTPTPASTAMGSSAYGQQLAGGSGGGAAAPATTGTGNLLSDKDMADVKRAIGGTGEGATSTDSTIPDKYKDYYGREITDAKLKQAIDAVGLKVSLANASLQQKVAVDKKYEELRKK